VMVLPTCSPGLQTRRTRSGKCTRIILLIRQKGVSWCCALAENIECRGSRTP